MGENRVISRRSGLAVSYGPLITLERSLLRFPLPILLTTGNLISTVFVRIFYVFRRTINKNPHKRLAKDTLNPFSFSRRQRWHRRIVVKLENSSWPDYFITNQNGFSRASRSKVKQTARSRDAVFRHHRIPLVEVTRPGYMPSRADAPPR